MALGFDNLAAIYAHGFDTLIDVRSPAEFAEDHIPGAISLPVLSDAERARVGTIYAQQSAFTARKVGAAIVARNAAAHLEGPLADHDGGWRPLVYCWRGGQRSGSFGSILKQVGWRADTIQGGYQTYRRLVCGAMYEQALAHRLIVLEGNTGTAKTDLLHLLAARGVQMVDLEGLAAHRGSVFGAMARPQPSQKAFEGALAAAFHALDPARPVVVEAESSKVGNLLIPPSVWKAMKGVRRMRISAPIEARAIYLTRAYGDISANVDALNATLAALIPHQGRERIAHWQALAQSGDLTTLARQLMELHYDPSYGRVGARRTAVEIGEVRSDDLTPAALENTADRLVELLAKAGSSPANRSGQTQAAKGVGAGGNHISFDVQGT